MTDKSCIDDAEARNETIDALEAEHTTIDALEATSNAAQGTSGGDAADRPEVF
jgi:hypothetical protein